MKKKLCCLPFFFSFGKRNNKSFDAHSLSNMQHFIFFFFFLAAFFMKKNKINPFLVALKAFAHHLIEVGKV
jgi:hypothetical protein